MRQILVTATFCVAAFLAAFIANEAAGSARANGIVGTLAGATVLAAFAWRRRDADILDVIVPSMCIAYCAYAGLAFSRVPFINIPSTVPYYKGTSQFMRGPLAQRIPVIVVVGVPYALVLTFLVALPISKIKLGKQETPHADDPMMKYLDASAKDKRSGR